MLVRLLVPLLMLTTSTGHAEQIKLNCDIQVVTNYLDGTKPKTENRRVVVDITDEGDIRLIKLSTHKVFLSVGNFKIEGTTSVVDKSDDTKWEISNTEERNGTLSVTNLRIDRNTGGISYKDVFTDNSGKTSESGDGTCRKVDATRKLF